MKKMFVILAMVGCLLFANNCFGANNNEQQAWKKEISHLLLEYHNIVIKPYLVEDQKPAAVDINKITDAVVAKYFDYMKKVTPPFTTLDEKQLKLFFLVKSKQLNNDILKDYARGLLGFPAKPKAVSNYIELTAFINMIELYQIVFMGKKFEIDINKISR